MKKIILSLVMAITAIGASAQNTYNVRVGGGFTNYYDDVYGNFNVMGQANFSLKDNIHWVFSPALQVATFDENISYITFINMGYRTIIGNGCLFVPKVGLAGGVYCDHWSNEFLAGPSIDLALELKHFAIGLTGFYSLTYENNLSMVSLNLGYTF